MILNGAGLLLDLNKSHRFGDSVQKNLKDIIIKYGNKFSIKNKDIILPSKIYKVKYQYNKKLSYYSIIYDGVREQSLYPFKVDFLDDTNMEKNDNCYIANIHKTDKISGTNMMETILKFLKIIKVKEVTLYDGAKIKCGNREIDLSYFKILEKGATFYQKFGFRFDVKDYQKKMFDNEENMVKTLDKLIKDFKNIELVYFNNAFLQIIDIANEVIKKQDYKNLNITYFHTVEPYYASKGKLPEIIDELVIEINYILGKTIPAMKNNKKYLYQVLIDLFYNDCNSYRTMEDNIINNMIYEVEYKKKKIILKHIQLFNTIRAIRYSSVKLTLN